MHTFLTVLSWIGRLVVALVLLAGMANCTQLGLNYASLDTDGKLRGSNEAARARAARAGSRPTCMASVLMTSP